MPTYFKVTYIRAMGHKIMMVIIIIFIFFASVGVLNGTKIGLHIQKWMLSSHCRGELVLLQPLWLSFPMSQKY